MSSGEIILFARRLREYGRQLEGDGFGHVGDLKAAIKLTCVRLEEVAGLIDALPDPELDKVGALVGVKRYNTDCLGVGADNVPGCDCRKIFNSIKRNSN